MKVSKITQVASAVALSLCVTAAYANETNSTATPKSTPATNANAPANANAPDMTGKQKATAIGAATGAVAGAVVGGPVGAVVGAGVGGYVGHEGTNAKGQVTPTPNASRTTDSMGREASNGMNGDQSGDSTVRDAQAALNAQGYSAGAKDGLAGPNTHAAIRKFQADKGLQQTGMLDSATKSALGL